MDILCSKCHVNPKRERHSWCKECAAEAARQVRALHKRNPTIEIRVCARKGCGKNYEWSSSVPKKVYCSSKCRDDSKSDRIDRVVVCEKICGNCKLLLPAEKFNVRVRSRDGLQAWCRQCNSDKGRRYRENNAETILVYREKNRDRQRERDKKRARPKTLAKYGLTESDFQRMSDAQDGRCAICNAVPNDALVVDHCHNSTEVRGLLCRLCNASLGGFGDDPDRLRAAISYLTA